MTHDITSDNNMTTYMYANVTPSINEIDNISVVVIYISKLVLNI